MLRKPKIQRFNEDVLGKYQIYNSLFLTLPFDNISDTGAFLPLFSEMCQKGYESNQNPTTIIDSFFEKFLKGISEEEKISLLFKFIQYIERQVVLFDAIEDAAFTTVNNMDGHGTMRNLKEEAQAAHKLEDLKEHLRNFKIRPVLTAHPTQFYPGSVLGIITDLALAIEKNDLPTIKKLLAQLGKTPFFKKKKPTPFDEAISLIWYLENVFYQASSKIFSYIQHNIFHEEELDNDVIKLGFWPGGDRDGNPFVTPEITLNVAERLKASVLRNYYRDVRKLKRRVTFQTVDYLMSELEQDLYDNIFIAEKRNTLSKEGFIEKLKEVRKILITDHQSLFVEEVTDLINKIRLFGLHFATLDIRQDSRVHHNVLLGIVRDTQKHKLNIFPENYENLSDAEQIEILTKISGKIDLSIITDEMAKSTLESIYVMREIQKNNGEEGCNRYIISNNQTIVNVLEAFAMIRLTGWENPSVDVVPLFETVDDLQHAKGVMDALYNNNVYINHLKQRGNVQPIMLGFSDGTKDGGYLMANWSIYKAKEELTQISRNYGIKVVFFDGRGGPPARGGGKTHQFYASLGANIENNEVQLTVQGQTISSNFGTIDSCQYNLEQLLSSGIINQLFAKEENILAGSERDTMQELAELSYKAYSDFKDHPKFLPYLENMSTLKYYAKTNIGSRPSKRGKSDGLVFSDLRAIPFVGSWSQLKQNVPGFFGVGTAISIFEARGEFDKVKYLYDHSLFFKTLIENSMMSLTKSFFKLTAYMQEDPEYGQFWTLIHNEYELTKRLLLKLTGYKELMEESEAMRASIKVREEIVLPLLTIQQFALKKIQDFRKSKGVDESLLEVYEKIVTRSLFGNINASRNSA